jgi:hypothetical protein
MRGARLPRRSDDSRGARLPRRSDDWRARLPRRSDDSGCRVAAMTLVDAFVPLRAAFPFAQLEPAVVWLGGASSRNQELGTVQNKKGEGGGEEGETQFIGGGVLVDRRVRIDQVRNC